MGVAGGRLLICLGVDWACKGLVDFMVLEFLSWSNLVGIGPNNESP